MNKIFKLIRLMIKEDWIHRSGWPMSRCTPATVILCADAEVAELKEAIDKGATREETLDECADVIACVCHIAILHNFNAETLTRAVINKLSTRFVRPGNPNAHR